MSGDGIAWACRIGRLKLSVKVSVRHGTCGHSCCFGPHLCAVCEVLVRERDMPSGRADVPP